MKNTDKEHVDYHNLLKAHNKICNIITAIDQTKGQYENAKQLEKVRSILKRSKKEVCLSSKGDYANFGFSWNWKEKNSSSVDHFGFQKMDKNLDRILDIYFQI